MKQSEYLFNKAQKVIPGGVNSPVRAYKSVGAKFPPFIQKGKGCYVQDVDGNQYIDFVGSWGPLILGHAHEEVVAVLKKTAENGTSFGAPTELEIALAEKIIELIPSIELVRLVNSGTEATMSAIRLARGITRKNKILKFEGCYHGHADSFLIKAGSGALTMGEPNSPGVPLELARLTLNARFNDVDSVEQLFSRYESEIAAIIVEPIAGNMGVIPPRPEFLQNLRRICDTTGTLLIFDEVMTGFRVDLGGAQSKYGIIPDLTTLGKVIGGGLPVGAFGGKKEYMNYISPSGPIYQAGTLSGNPLAVSAGLKTLEIISRDNYIAKLNNKSKILFEGINEILSKKSPPFTLNYVNSMGSIFFTEKEVYNYDDVITADLKLFNLFFKSLLENGIYIAPSQFEAMFVSGAHGNEEIDKTLEIINNTLKMI